MTATYNISTGGQPPERKAEVMENKIIRSGLRIPYDLNTWLILEAKKIGITKNALVLQILWDWVKKEEKTERKEKQE